MADPGLYNALLEENNNLQKRVQNITIEKNVTTLNECPWETSLYSETFPLIQNPTGCLCVYDSSSGNLRCGVCCQWTVPAGASVAQFQMWGAGSGAGAAQCCGGANFGTTGAFATVVIDVTPGDNYTLCAGCAYCCYVSTASTHNRDGCASYVIGPGLTGVCADGGEGNKVCGMALRGSPCCRYQNPDCTGSGPCYCSLGTWYCFDNSCATCGVVPWIANPNKTYHGIATNSCVYGLPSAFDCGCLSTSNYGYHISPPTIDECHECRVNSCCCFSFTSGTCCGGCRCRVCTGRFCWPGAGGFANHMMGGSTSYCGDAGRGGMVRVTWC